MTNAKLKIMKSTELRLGNRIIRVDNLGNKKEIIVTAFIFSEIEVRCGVVYLPIPLNEEWLFRLPEDLVSEDIPTWVIYVHQLQNWYFIKNKCEKELLFR